MVHGIRRMDHRDVVDCSAHIAEQAGVGGALSHHDIARSYRSVYRHLLAASPLYRTLSITIAFREQPFSLAARLCVGSYRMLRIAHIGGLSAACARASPSPARFFSFFAFENHIATCVARW